MKLRPYQQEAYDNIMRDFSKCRSTLAVLATGLGKTVCFSHVAKAFREHGRIMVLAHREELIRQAADKAEQICNTDTDIEMGEHYAHSWSHFKADIVVSTVQTQNAGMEGEGRMTRFDPDEFSLLVIDEAHHAPADSYRRVIEYYKNNPSLKVLGVTATPDRADEKALGQVFESVAYEYDIRNGIDDGWLVPIEQRSVFIQDLDYSQVRTTAGDLNGKDLAQVLEFEAALHGIASPTVELTGDRKTLIFAASVAQAERLAEIINRHKSDSARFVYGGTPKEIRRRYFADYAERKFQYLVNVGVACLDEQTEILTSDGWVGYKEISYQHKIANWEEGAIYFEKPLAIEVRDRRQDEEMVVLETKNRSIRVTDDHRMLYRTYQQGKFKECRARDLVNRKAELPINGIAEPFEFLPEKLTQYKSNIKRRISANSYHLRKKLGLSIEESKKLAAKRIEIHGELKHKKPSELTIAECELIGFWLGDGTKSKLQSGGIEYIISQAESYTGICRWIRTVLNEVGTDYIERRKLPKRANRNPLLTWSMPRGTGFEEQKRKGLFALEPYLEKDGTLLFWGLNQEQFDALCRGFWFADGEHGNASEKKDCSYRIANTNKKLLDLLQAIAVCRGYRANINGGHKRSEKHKPLWKLSLSKYDSHCMTKYRLQFEKIWKPEKVWCVKSHTGFIVTRRRGTVTITGNTEGFDDPGIEVVVMARPTKSRCLYTQMCGRGTRPLPGLVDGPETAHARQLAIVESTKPNVEIIDFVGNCGKHKLVTSADVLGGIYDDEIVERAKKNAEDKSTKTGKPVDIASELQLAEREIAKERARREDAETRAHVRLRAQYSTAKVNPFDVFDLTPHRERDWHKGRQPTTKQLEFLHKNGVDTKGLSFTHASQVIDNIIKRRRDNKCSYKQAKILKRNKYSTDVSFQEASAIIDKIAAKQGWKKRA